MFLCAGVFLAASVQASPLLQTLGPSSLFDRIDHPLGWRQDGSVHSEATLKLSIGLKQNDIKGLEAKLLDISNPESDNYGKWLSKDELEKYTKPSAQAIEKVHQWLAAHDIAAGAIGSSSPDWIDVTVPVSKAESMLNTRYSLFTKGRQTVPGTLEYSLPRFLHDHVDTIQPTNAFHYNKNKGGIALQHENRRTARATDPCTNGVNANCINAAYNVDYIGSGNTSLTVTGMIGLSASHDDATKFLKTYFPKGSGHDFKDVSTGDNVHANNNSNPDLEGNLDSQIALSIGYPAPVTYLTVGPNDDKTQFGDELIALGQYLNSANSPPLSISSSYYGNEPEFSSSYKDRICNEFMKAGARGVSVLFCTGDYGVSGLDPNDTCSNGFVPTFPVSCPYVTAVASTEFNSGGTHTEKAAAFKYIEGGTSGGGFSRYWSAPKYQSVDTKAYITGLGNAFKGKYNANGRGYPDISLIGVYWNIILKGEQYFAEGTSASTPAWASLIAQINDYRASIGKSSLGFLNPVLYTNKAVRAALRDVSSGNISGCGGSAFSATKGWDAATGLGSMDFSALRKALASI